MRVKINYHGSKKIDAIKWLREMSNLGLREAKEVIEGNGDWVEIKEAKVEAFEYDAPLMKVEFTCEGPHAPTKEIKEEPIHVFPADVYAASPGLFFKGAKITDKNDYTKIVVTFKVANDGLTVTKLQGLIEAIRKVADND